MTTRGFLYEAFERAGLDAEVGVSQLAKVIGEDFVEDQYARLEEAGSAPHERVRLGQVFVDLTATRRASDLDDGTVANEQERFPCLRSLAEEVPRLKGAWHHDLRPGEKPDRCIEGRVLLVGGPGQGKSTLVQHLVQGHRRQCLRDVDGLRDIRGLSEALEHDTHERKPEHQPLRTRLPIVVPLASFAAWRAQRNETPGSLVLLRYVAQKLWRDAISVNDLDLILASTPWLLVFDGLDEVPGARDRAAAMQCIEAFFEGHGDYGEREVQPLVIATTRPQGWGREFASHVPLYLSALTLPEALAYSAGVTAARYPTQLRLRERVDERVRTASSEPAMHQLLRSPLLVAIMTRLIAEQGQAPRLRWEVFERFYETIFHRELSRGTSLSPVLAAERPIIHELHRHTGLVLHARSEREEGSASSVSRAWLRDAALRLTETDDIPEVQRAQRVDALIDAVEQRLVLLVERSPDCFSYELRSFQEFMAAWALTTGTDGDVKTRIERIATSPAWRNVLLLALGRLFAERSPHRETLSVGLCAWLDDAEANPLAAMARSGASLALDILHDGLAAHSPKVVAGLAELAMGVLECPTDEWRARRLRAAQFVGDLRSASEVTGRDLVAELRTRIARRLADDATDLASWSVITALAPTDAESEAIASRVWDSLDVAQQDDLAPFHDESSEMLAWMAPRICCAWRLRDPNLLRGVGVSGRDRTLDAWRASTTAPFRRAVVCRGEPVGRVSQREQLASPENTEALRTVVSLADVPPMWRPLQIVAGFLLAPSSETLAVALEHLAPCMDQARECSALLPWIFALALHTARGPRDLDAIAARARASEFGDVDRWRTLDQMAPDMPLATEAMDELLFHADPVGHALQTGRWWTPEAEPIGDQHRAAAPFAPMLHMFALASRAVAARKRSLVWCALRWYGFAESDARRDPDLGLLSEVLPGSSPFWLQHAERLDADLDASFWLKRVRAILHAYPSRVWSAKTPWTAHLQSRSTPGALMARALFGLPGTDALSPSDFDDADLCACVALLLLLRGSPSDESTLLPHLVTPDWDARPLLLSHLADDFFPGDHPSALLRTLHRQLADRTLRDQCRGVAAFWLRARYTGLADAASWKALGLALPSPEDVPSPESAMLHAFAGQLVHGPVITIDSVYVSALRGLSELRLEPSPPAQDRGQWVVLLGENGTGKTTLLRGITLALTDRSNVTSVLNDARAMYVRNGAKQGACTVTLHGLPQTMTIYRHDDKESANLNGVKGALPWVVAYGCRRGGALGGREPDRTRTPFSDVATLFDDDRGLVDIAQWIITQQAAAPQDADAATAYAAITSAVGDVIGYRFLPVRKDGLWVQPVGGGDDVQFASLSDGYLTTAGWIGDLLVRYVERNRAHPERLTSDFPKHMTGVVIVDEIDQHLHPRWQVKVIGQVRALFPRMTFVVTTHNPLTVAGARREEVFLIDRDARGEITVAPARFDPRLRTGTELFTKFFGISDVFPNELGRKLHRYGTLASNPYRDDAEETELHEIIDVLKQEGVDPGFAPEPRAADA